MQTLPMGPTAALVECAPGAAGQIAAAAARRGLVPGRRGVVEVVPAATTVLIDCTDPGALTSALEIMTAVLDGADGAPTPRRRRADGDTGVVELPVRFDGPDLDEVSTGLGVGPDEVVAAVCASPLEVAFCGFSPGFAYLTGLDPALHLPRRDRPRPRVPRGSFAIAAGYAAVYPSSSPGGWHLLGTTQFEVWSISRRPPAALRPGMAVRIVADTGDDDGDGQDDQPEGAR